jgi:hypothetical protein
MVIPSKEGIQAFNTNELICFTPHPPLPQETVSQVRSWFDRLTTNGPGALEINYLAVRPEPVEGRAAN